MLAFVNCTTVGQSVDDWAEAEVEALAIEISKTQRIRMSRARRIARATLGGLMEYAASYDNAVQLDRLDAQNAYTGVTQKLSPGQVEDYEF